MRILTISLCVAALALTACSSRINPVNWGRGDQSAVLAPNEPTAPEINNPLIPEGNGQTLLSGLISSDEEYLGIPIDQISSVTVESTPGGAIVYATGLSNVQGVFDVRMVSDDDGGEPVDGVLLYTLKGVYLADAVRGGPEQFRTVRAGVVLTNNDLADVRVIRVNGRVNAQETRRR